MQNMLCFSCMYIHVRAFPQAKKEKIEKVDEQNFHIFCREKAERNQVNDCILRLIADYFSLPSPKQVRIVSGHRKPKKILSILF